MPYAFAFHYAPTDPIRREQFAQLLASPMTQGVLEDAFAHWTYVPSAQSKLRASRPYRRGPVLAKVDGCQIESLWLRSEAGRSRALLTLGRASPLHRTTQVVLVLDDPWVTVDVALRLTGVLATGARPLAGVVNWHDDYEAAESIALGAHVEGLSRTDGARALETARAAGEWGPKIRGPGWLTYLSAAHVLSLGSALESEISAGCVTVDSMGDGVLLALSAGPGKLDGDALERLRTALGTLIVGA